MAFHRHDATIPVAFTLPFRTQLGLVQFKSHAVAFVDCPMLVQPQVRVLTKTRTRPMTRWKGASLFFKETMDLSMLDLQHLYTLMSGTIDICRVGITASGELAKHSPAQI